MFRLTAEGAEDARQDDNKIENEFLDRMYRIDRIKFHPVNPVILSNRIFLSKISISSPLPVERAKIKHAGIVSPHSKKIYND